MKLTALPCLCADVFDGSDEIRPGGEALNFAVHASAFQGIEVALLGAVGQDDYGEYILRSIADKPIDTRAVRIDPTFPTAHNVTYLTPEGDRYYLPDSWHGDILEHFILTPDDEKLLAASDVVFVHYYASCFEQVIALKRRYGFRLAVDFDVFRDFDRMRELAGDIDFFMISGEEGLLRHFEDFSKAHDGLFNMSLGEKGSVTYHRGQEYRVSAEPVETVVDTTGCGDSYHAGFVCDYLLHGDIEQAMHTGSKIAATVLTHVGGFTC